MNIYRTKKAVATFIAILVLAMPAGCGQAVEVEADNTQTVNAEEADNSIVQETEAADNVENDSSNEEEQNKGTVITRLDAINELYKFNGSPVLDFHVLDISNQGYEKILVTDMDSNDDVTKWYAYTLGCSGIVANPDATFTLGTDIHADRLFVAELILDDMTNHAFYFDKVDESIVPYTDLESEIENEFHRRALTYLCVEGVMEKSKAVNCFEPHVEVTDTELDKILEAYGEMLKKNGFEKELSVFVGSNRTIGVTLNAKTNGDNVGSGATEVADVSSDNPVTDAKAESEVDTESDKFVAAGFNYTAIKEEKTYTTECYASTDKTTGTATFADYTRKNIDDMYDEITVTVKYKLSDENALKGGACSYFGIEDAYNYADGKNSVGVLYQGDYNCKFTVEYGGTVYDNCLARAVFNPTTQWVEGVGAEVTEDYILTVPKGYDGMIVWIAGYPGKGQSVTASQNLSSLDSFYAFRCN